MGEVIRRFTARTVAQQLGPAIEAATAPFQYALSTRAGCECVSHVLQALCELDEDATVTSIDGISAYDTISRRAMIAGLEPSARWQCCITFCSVVLFRAFRISVGRCGRRGAHNPPRRRRGAGRPTFALPFFQWDSTTRCRQSIRACGSMSDCLLTWTTSGWWSCGVGQGSGSIPTGSEIPSIQQGIKVLGCLWVTWISCGRRRFGTSKLPTQGVET